MSNTASRATPVLADRRLDFMSLLGMNMARNFNVVIEQDEDGFFVASVPSLPGCHTQARSLDVLMERVREAIELYVEVEGIPASSLSFVGVEQVTIAA